MPALCNKVANELLENGETILPMMVYSMDGSEPVSVRIEGFRLAQHLAVMVIVFFFSFTNTLNRCVYFVVCVIWYFHYIGR